MSNNFELQSYTAPSALSANFEFGAITPPEPSGFIGVLFNFGGI